MIHVDKEALQCRRAAWTCEHCGRPTPHGCDPAHVYSRGAGRVDHRWNLCSLCWQCHRWGNHGIKSDPSDDDLIAIVCKREGVTPDQIETLVFQIRLLPKDATKDDVDRIEMEIRDGTL